MGHVRPSPDTATQTRLLHNTRIETQPWKTGLPADYHEHALRGWWDIFRRDSVRYQPHPDPRQEHLLFSLLHECLDNGSITESYLRRPVRRNYIRKDTFEVLARLPKHTNGEP